MASAVSFVDCRTRLMILYYTRVVKIVKRVRPSAQSRRCLFNCELARCRSKFNNNMYVFLLRSITRTHTHTYKRVHYEISRASSIRRRLSVLTVRAVLHLSATRLAACVTRCSISRNRSHNIISSHICRRRY